MESEPRRQLLAGLLDDVRGRLQGVVAAGLELDVAAGFQLRLAGDVDADDEYIDDGDDSDDDDDDKDTTTDSKKRKRSEEEEE